MMASVCRESFPKRSLFSEAHLQRKSAEHNRKASFCLAQGTPLSPLCAQTAYHERVVRKGVPGLSQLWECPTKP